MSVDLNCSNCGAPIDFKLTKCPYCCTSYLIHKSIYKNINDNERFVLINKAIADAIVAHNWEGYVKLKKVKESIVNEFKLS